MKKYPVSKFYIGTYYICLLIMLVYEALVFSTLTSTNLAPMDYFDFSIGILGIFLILYIMLTDLPTAKFSFSEEGITMYVGFKKYETPWSEFVSAGLLMKDPAKYSRGIPNIMWVYFSKTYLTEKEIGYFLYKTRKDLDRIAYFQCEERLLHMVMEKLPDNLREDLEFYLSFRSPGSCR